MGIAAIQFNWLHRHEYLCVAAAQSVTTCTLRFIHRSFEIVLFNRNEINDIWLLRAHNNAAGREFIVGGVHSTDEWVVCLLKTGSMKITLVYLDLKQIAHSNSRTTEEEKNIITTGLTVTREKHAINGQPMIWANGKKKKTETKQEKSNVHLFSYIFRINYEWIAFRAMRRARRNLIRTKWIDKMTQLINAIALTAAVLLIVTDRNDDCVRIIDERNGNEKNKRKIDWNCL